MKTNRILHIKFSQKKKERLRLKSKRKRKLRNRFKRPQKGDRPQKRNIFYLRKKRKPIILRAPTHFSLIHYPEDVLTFFKTMKSYLNSRITVYMDFSNIQSVSSDAIALLLAKINDPNYRQNNKIHGIRPNNHELDKVFLDSGFYKLIGLSKDIPKHGQIHSKKNTIVDIEVAVNARKLASMKTFSMDIHLKPLYRTLIECMANTKKHAKGNHIRDITWWLTVYHDPETKVTSFSFIDTGVGIFKSSRIKKITKIAVKFGLTTNYSILLDILNGKIESSTGLSYRGKGLPKIYEDYKLKNINNLHIITNDVYANFEKQIFTKQKNQLNGTFLYWEILPS